MAYIQEICKGILIGAAQIAPGVSGGTLAISMGIYQKIIEAVTKIFRKPAESIRILMPYGLGAVFGVVSLSFFMEYLMKNYPLAVCLVFTGLILGSVPSLLEKVNVQEKQREGRGICVLVFLVLLLFSAAEGVTSWQLWQPGKWLGIGQLAAGMLAAASMVIPGISGTMILMMVGCYQPLLSGINRLIKAVATVNGAAIMEEVFLLFPFGVGLAAGVFLCALAVEWLLRNWEREVYWGILGLVLSSPFVILGQLHGFTSWPELMVGLMGFVLAYVGIARLENQS